MTEKKKPPQGPRVYEVSVRTPEELKALLTQMLEQGMMQEQQIAIPGSTFTMASETAFAGALTALHQCGHDLLVAGGISSPCEREVGAMAAKLLSNGLRAYLKNGPPSQGERDAFNEEWEKQSSKLVSENPACPCAKCRQRRGEEDGPWTEDKDFPRGS